MSEVRDWEDQILLGILQSLPPPTSLGRSFLLFVDIVVGCLQHPGHQDYELLKADLFIFIGIQILEYFVNGRLIFGVLLERGLGSGRASTTAL